MRNGTLPAGLGGHRTWGERGGGGHMEMDMGEELWGCARQGKK